MSVLHIWGLQNSLVFTPRGEKHLCYTSTVRAGFAARRVNLKLLYLF